MLIQKVEFLTFMQIVKKENNPEGFKEMLDTQFPLGRMGTPEEVADVITFICSEKASLLTGAAIPLDGGESSAF